MVELAKSLGTRIRVGYRRWTRLKAMMGENSDVLLRHFVHQTEEEKEDLIVEIVHTKGLTLNFLTEQRKKHNDCNTIGILPSGLCYVEGKLSTCMKDESGDVELYNVRSVRAWTSRRSLFFSRFYYVTHYHSYRATHAV